jgi:osmotically-inducible protein OsmY
VVLSAGCADRNGNGQPDSISQPAVDKAVSSLKSSAEKTAVQAEHTAEDLGANATTTAKIKAGLAANNTVNVLDVDVTTQSEKKFVTLQGTVQSAAQKVLAGKIATQNAPSGYKIVNQLKVAGAAAAPAKAVVKPHAAHRK